MLIVKFDLPPNCPPQNCRNRAIAVWQPDFLDIKVTKKDWSWEPGHCKFVHLDVLPPQHAMLIPGLDWWLRLWRFPPLQNYPLPTSCLTWRSRQRRQQMMETWKTNLGRVIPLGPGLFVVDQDPMSSTDPNCGLWWRSHPLSNASNPNHPPAHTGIRMTSTKNWPEWI